MVFSSPIFLFLFLPVVLTVYFCLPGLRLRNGWLLAVSLIFYAWGEVAFLFLLLASTIINYFLGRWLDKVGELRRRRLIVSLAVALNIGLLAFFKYSNFAVENFNALLLSAGAPLIQIDPVRLPIGISFFTFHALSYVIDIYRRKTPSAKNPGDTALYIFFFPQLIAGPILRWSGIAPQLEQRTVSLDGFADGIRRFVTGLAKKMIIANAVAVPADQIFGLAPGELTPALAWLGVTCYTLQIYFDFSGYSDMAVGLGKMFGFQFLENFNYPYVAQSIRDFWRRWHISLSSWFRDYLYIPLGGNRCSAARNHFNLVLVFFLCGLWHGASWTFAIWGLYHGAFLVLERTKLGEAIDAMPRPVRHGYTILVIMIGWVFFRADSLAQATAFLSHMAGLNASTLGGQPIARYVTNQLIFALAAGVIFSTPIWPKVKEWGNQRLQATRTPARLAFSVGAGIIEPLLLIGLLLVSAAWLAGSTYNPFIYFRF